MKQRKQFQIAGLMFFSLILGGFNSKAKTTMSLKRIYSGTGYLIQAKDTLHLRGRIIDENGTPLPGAT